MGQDKQRSGAKLLEMKREYLVYFSQVKSDKAGGRGKIQHVIACRQLAKEGKLKRLPNGEYELNRKKKIHGTGQTTRLIRGPQRAIHRASEKRGA